MHCIILNILTKLTLKKFEKKTKNFRRSGTLTLSSEQHSYNTRSTSFDQLVIESFRTNLRKFSPGISGKYFWNNIPLSIRNKSSKNAFKSSLKRYYICCSVLIYLID